MTSIELSSGISGIILAVSIIMSLKQNKPKGTKEVQKEEKKDYIGANEVKTRSDWRKEESPPPYERSAMSNIQRNQLELDGYRNRQNKTNYEIGLEYERYVGYKWEKQFYKVVYYGAAYGLRDKGIDLIASKDGNTYIIQCKRWSSKNQVHENAVFQLAGTVKYLREKKGNQMIRGVLVTSTVVSQAAREAASKLKIKIYENFKMDNNYPCIKCTIDEISGQKIYFLPNDNNYDNCKMTDPNACYAYTIKEAEDKGFRRINKGKRG